MRSNFGACLDRERFVKVRGQCARVQICIGPPQALLHSHCVSPGDGDAPKRFRGCAVMGSKVGWTDPKVQFVRVL